jgi:FixJ family two-component response regulator
MTRSSSEPSKSVVLVVDDDPTIREAIKELLHSVSLESTAYSSAPAFLSGQLPDQTSCLITDVRLPGLGGLDLQAEMVKRHINIPIIFVTGYGDVEMSVRAMKAGAFGFLTKPFRAEDLLDAVRGALDEDRKRREYEDKAYDIRRRYDALSERQQEIMILVITGLMNKQVAAEIGIAEVTVKVHRHNIMHKLGARNVAELVRMAAVLELPQADYLRIQG